MTSSLASRMACVLALTAALAVTACGDSGDGPADTSDAVQDSTPTDIAQGDSTGGGDGPLADAGSDSAGSATSDTATTDTAATDTAATDTAATDTAATDTAATDTAATDTAVAGPDSTTTDAGSDDSHIDVAGSDAVSGPADTVADGDPGTLDDGWVGAPPNDATDDATADATTDIGTGTSDIAELDVTPDSEGGEDASPPGPVVAFTLPDHNPNSASFEMDVSPADHKGKITGFYFTHAT